ncbi:MDR family oxidoreductase [Novosphingobium sp. TH158]|uniref:acrylyl-CoA reductase (NADPH) n=1 Tax=Novosphingobium sp. TH158 TaxID=2067455 RepID=UPI000C7DCD5E|nr:MDR family oxidoreductase [Novosphingobium sp. TH158]PLK26180.1 alcohol dehydrogenase [Novosphingobium sp. TH158]
MFTAILIEKTETGQTVGLKQLDESALPEGDVTIDVLYSTINYKDGLAITGAGPVVRRWPMVPGIDLVGTVSASETDEFKPGDTVLLNGWGVGEVHWGGLATKARLKSDWLIKLPAGFTPQEAMAIGTAGYTAALSVDALVNAGVKPEDGPILVTGTPGGVGSVATALLAKAGYHVVASYGDESEKEYLTSLGAKEFVHRDEYSAPGKPFQKETWAGVVDSVGSHTLCNAIAQTKYRGFVTACGLAQGADLPGSVMPFILRGVSLLGIDSVMCPKGPRMAAWARLDRDLDRGLISKIGHEVNLEGAIQAGHDIVAGKIRGRVLVDVNR